MSNAFAKRALRVSLKHDANADHIAKALAEIYRLSGCVACGIRGIDVILHGGDPEIDVLGRLPGVAHVDMQQVF